MNARIGVIVILGLTQTLAWASSFYIPAVLSEPMARDLGVSTPWIYAALSVGLTVSALLGPALGKAIDRHGGRPVLCGSNLVFAAGLVMLSLAGGVTSLMLAWLVLGVSMGAGLYEAAFASVTHLYGYDSRGAITGITLLAGFASTVGWPLSALFEHLAGWRGACLIWAALHVLVGLPLHAWALRTPRGGPAAGAGATAGGAVSTLTPIPRAAPDVKPPQHMDRGMLLLALIFAASGTVTIGMATNLPQLFMSMGVTRPAAIATASLLGPAQVAARVLEFSARHRVTPLVSARLANALHPLAALAVALGGAPAIALFSVLHGAGSGLLTICRGTLPLAMYGPDGYGLRIGRIFAPARIGQALAPFLFGIAIDKLGVATLLISCTLSLVALAALSRLVLPAGAVMRVG
jgi:MFS family permease